MMFQRHKRFANFSNNLLHLSSQNLIKTINELRKLCVFVSISKSDFDGGVCNVY